MAQRMGRDWHAFHASPARDARNHGLDLAHWHRRVAVAEKQRLGFDHRSARVEIGSDRPTRGGVQRYFACLESLALSDTHAARPIVDSDVANAKCGEFANPDTSLQHQLDKSIVPRRQALTGGTRRAQHRVDLDVGQANRLPIARSAHWPDVMDNVSAESGWPIPSTIGRRSPLARCCCRQSPSAPGMPAR